MELEAQLRAFAAFARKLSFSAAAEELLISQPAVSKHIAELERRVGVLLVKREPRGGTLTPTGEFLAAYVLRAEAILSQAARGLVQFREPGTGDLSLVASGVPGTYLIPKVLAAFHLAFPAVNLTVNLTTSAGAIEFLRSHQAELGVVGGFAAAPEIEAERLADDEILVVGPPSMANKKVSQSELEQLTWVSREEGSATRATVEAAWRDIGISPQRHLELPSWEAVKIVVAAGSGVAACSRVAVEQELANGTLINLDLPGWNVHRTISIVRMRDAPLTPSATQFLQMLREHFRA